MFNQLLFLAIGGLLAAPAQRLVGQGLGYVKGYIPVQIPYLEELATLFLGGMVLKKFNHLMALGLQTVIAVGILRGLLGGRL